MNEIANKITRFGWIGQKIGMTSIFEKGKLIAITVVKIFNQNIISKTEKDGMIFLKVGVEHGKLRKKPQIDELNKLGKPLCNKIKEFKILKEESEALGDVYNIEMFDEKFLDVTSKSIGKGFAGGMKRWNFHGTSATHGVSLTHRAIGSTGTRDKNWKGKKMPGRLGAEQITIQSIPVSYIDRELEVIGLNGSIPGKNGSLVVLRKAIKKIGVGL